MGQVTTSVMEASAVAEAFFPTLPAWHRPRQLSRVLTRIFSWRGRVPLGEPGQEGRPPFPLDYNVDGGGYEKEEEGKRLGGEARGVLVGEEGELDLNSRMTWHCSLTRGW